MLVLLNQLNWFQFLILEGGLLVILIDCMIFLSPFLDVKRMSMSRGCQCQCLFPGTARPWSFLPLECFPLTYDLRGFESRVNRYLLIVGSF